MRKKTPLFLALCFAPALLASCNPSLEKISPVILDMGTILFDGDEVNAKQLSHMKEISLASYNDMVAEKKNFLLLVGGEFDCSCWTSFHNEVLVPYILRNHLLLYWIPLSGNESALQEAGLSLSASHETLAIFEEGELKYQHTTADSTSAWVKDASTFSAWMNVRIEAPRLLSLSKGQLDAKYEGNEDFSVFFSRSTCGDCSFLERSDLKPYFASHLKEQKIPENYLYYLDCDQVGIRYVEGEDGKTYNPSSQNEEYASLAASQWKEFKKEYGLAESEDNPAGWGEGFVPSIYHIHPNGGEKRGDAIDFSGTFYNETLDNGIIEDTYFTEERVSKNCLDYLASSSLSTKSLTGLSLDASLERHEALQKYENPILTLLLDSIL